MPVAANWFISKEDKEVKKANICHCLGRMMLIMEVNLFTPETCLKCYSYAVMTRILILVVHFILCNLFCLLKVTTSEHSAAVTMGYIHCVKEREILFHTTIFITLFPGVVYEFLSVHFTANLAWYISRQESDFVWIEVVSCCIPGLWSQLLSNALPIMGFNVQPSKVNQEAVMCPGISTDWFKLREWYFHMKAHRR